MKDNPTSVNQSALQFIRSVREIRSGVNCPAQLSALISYNVGVTMGMASGSYMLSTILGKLLISIDKADDILELTQRLESGTKNTLQVFTFLCAELAELVLKLDLDELEKKFAADNSVQQGFAE